MKPGIHRIALVLLFVLGAIAGCGGRSITPPFSAPVNGTVTMGGQPVTGVLVKFHPQFDIGRIQFIPSGETDSEGRFLLSTGADGNGAPPGDYVVTFEKLRVESDIQNSGIEMEVDEFGGKYSNPQTSPWLVTVEDGENELEPFELE